MISYGRDHRDVRDDRDVRFGAGGAGLCRLPSLLAHSETFQSWSSIGSSINPVVTDNALIGPTGIMNAATIQSAQNVTTDPNTYSVVRMGPIDVVPGPYTFALDVIAVTASVLVLYLNDLGTVDGLNFLVCSLTPGWKRFAVTQLCRNSTAFPSFGWFGADYSVAGLVVGVAQAMLNAGSSPCSYKAVA